MSDNTHVLVFLSDTVRIFFHSGSSPDIVIEPINEPGNVSLFSYYQYPIDELGFEGQQFLVSNGYTNTLPKAGNNIPPRMLI